MTTYIDGVEQGGSGGGSGGSRYEIDENFAGSTLDSKWTESTNTGGSVVVDNGKATLTRGANNGATQIEALDLELDDLPIRIEGHITRLDTNNNTKAGFKIASTDEGESETFTATMAKSSGGIECWIEGNRVSNVYGVSTSGTQWMALELRRHSTGMWYEVFSSANASSSRPDSDEWVRVHSNRSLSSAFTKNIKVCLFAGGYAPESQHSAEFRNVRVLKMQE